MAVIVSDKDILVNSGKSFKALSFRLDGNLVSSYVLVPNIQPYIFTAS